MLGIFLHVLHAKISIYDSAGTEELYKGFLVVDAPTTILMADTRDT